MNSSKLHPDGLSRLFTPTRSHALHVYGMKHTEVDTLCAEVAPAARAPRLLETDGTECVTSGRALLQWCPSRAVVGSLLRPSRLQGWIRRMGLARLLLDDQLSGG